MVASPVHTRRLHIGYQLPHGSNKHLPAESCSPTADHDSCTRGKQKLSYSRRTAAEATGGTHPQMLQPASAKPAACCRWHKGRVYQAGTRPLKAYLDDPCAIVSGCPTHPRSSQKLTGQPANAHAVARDGTRYPYSLANQAGWWAGGRMFPAP